MRLKCPSITFMTSSSSMAPNSSIRDTVPSSVHQASSPCHLESFALSVASGWDNSPPRASPLHGSLLHVTQLLFRHLLLSLASPHPSPSTGSKAITITPFLPCFIVVIFHNMRHYISLVHLLSPHQNTSSTEVGTFVHAVL